MARRIRRLVLLVALVAAMTLGGASAAFGHGKSHAAKCNQAASIETGSNYNSMTANGNFTGVPDGTFAKGGQAWNRCTVDANP